MQEDLTNETLRHAHRDTTRMSTSHLEKIREFYKENRRMPSHSEIGEVIITGEAVRGEAKPTLVPRGRMRGELSA